MTHSYRLTLPAFFAQTVSKHRTRPSLALVGDTPFTYGDADARIRALIRFMEDVGFRPGDRAGILSTNMPHWAIAYYAVTFMKGVAVPLLPDFHHGEIENIIDHSGLRILFISDGLRKKVAGLPGMGSILMIRIEDFTILSGVDTDVKYSVQGTPRNDYDVREDDLAAIIYTSGTTGKPKGVMLTHGNLCFTAVKSGRVQKITENDRFLSILPLSHTYENTIGMILPMTAGACIYYLGRPPSAPVLLPALKEIRPTVMLSVPLIIEKIFRNSIQPKFKGNAVLRLMIKVPFLRRRLNRVAGRKLMETFGGELHFFGIGGAKLNRSVEKFLIEARFPYAIGYGLTESSPLLAGCNPNHTRLGSTGPAIEEVELKINEPDPLTGEGEIWAKGPNVMKGYYRDPELTAEAVTPEGWLKTGDLGVFDKDGNLYIRGRLKNMIVLAGGENIYPEEIESVINNFRHVVDSLVLEQKGKLVALVHFNMEEIEEHYGHLRHDLINFAEHTIEKLAMELQHYVNHRVNKFSQVQVVMVQPVPFEKTATMKIKRYLYC